MGYPGRRVDKQSKALIRTGNTGADIGVSMVMPTTALERMLDITTIYHEPDVDSSPVLGTS